MSNAVIERAIRLISIERGHDPRDYTIIAFGGAGGLHACDLAAALEMRGVLLPVFPGALSALGILRADVVRDFSRTILLPVRMVKEAKALVLPAIRAIGKDADRFLSEEGFNNPNRRLEFSLDVRYVGQAYDLSVSMTGDFVAAFHRAHERAYGHADATRPIEIVNVRCRATGFLPYLFFENRIVSGGFRARSKRPREMSLPRPRHIHSTLRAPKPEGGPAVFWSGNHH